MLNHIHPPTGPRPLVGTYLAHDLRQQAMRTGRPFVYANFVASLDGRIAIPHPTRAGLAVPHGVVNERDWRLFQELAAQADVIITSGRYLRDWADGRPQEILQTDDPRFADLGDWRQAQGLAPQPDIAILSRTLDFPIPEVLRTGGRRVIIFTTAEAHPARVRDLQAQAGQLFVVGEQSIDGRRLVQQMSALGYQTIYSATGPQILHLLLAGGVLNRLYLTTVQRIIAGQPFVTIAEGDLLAEPATFTLHSLAQDEAYPQLFATYDIQRVPGALPPAML
jgi:riboflavin biosynthesis pyrimidine reductase